MPEIRPESSSISMSRSRRAVRHKQTTKPAEAKQNQQSSSPPNRKELFRYLMAIQINTAGLSGPYRTQEETLARVKGNHSAVREVRKVLRRSLVLPRRGPLWELLVTECLRACNGDLGRTARMLGASLAQVRRTLLKQSSENPN